MPLEWALLPKGWAAAKEAFPAVRWLLRRWRGRQLTAEQKVAARQKWKPMFEEHIRVTHRRKLRRDAIVRDMGRLDHYPDVAEGKGISAWFRVGLVGTYHRGVEFGLSWYGLKDDPAVGGWRFVKPDGSEESDAKAFLVGRVPFEAIEQVDWDGDEYYPFPHIYCHFEHKREPYEKVALCSENDNPSSGAPPYYTDLFDYEEVRLRSKRVGIVY